MKKRITFCISILFVLIQFVVPVQMIYANAKAVDNVFDVKEVNANETERQIIITNNGISDYDEIELRLPDQAEFDETVFKERFDEEYEYIVKDNILIFPKVDKINLNLVNVTQNSEMILTAKKNKKILYQTTYRFSPDKPDNSELKDKKLSFVDKLRGNFGDLNTSLSIEGLNKEVDSGKTVDFKFIFKTTGSEKDYENAKLVFDLPLDDNITFTQDLSDLKIEGVEPVFDNKNNQLVYEFLDLKPGKIYERVITLNSRNGYTPNNTEVKLQGVFTTTENERIVSQDKSIIKASTEIVIEKRFTGRVWNGTKKEWQIIPNKVGLISQWEITVKVPNKEYGQLYLNESEQIVITDTLGKGLSFVNGNSSNNFKEEGKKLIWHFNNPSYNDQDKQKDYLFNKSVKVNLRSDKGTEGQYLNNDAKVETFNRDKVKISDKTNDNIYVFDDKKKPVSPEGSLLYPPHFPPTGSGDEYKANIYMLQEPDSTKDFYDDALLQFGMSVASTPLASFDEIKDFNVSYNIDKHLVFTGVTTPGTWRYYPYGEYYGADGWDPDKQEKLEKEPVYDIYGIVNGKRKLLLSDAKDTTYYSRKDLGLSEEDVLLSLEYQFKQAFPGMYAHDISLFNFKVEKGYLGEVTNNFEVTGTILYDGQSEKIYYDPTIEDWSDPHYIPEWGRDISVNIVERKEDVTPTATVSVSLKESSKSQVKVGDNRLLITYKNHSDTVIEGPIENVVLLPLGVKVDNANPRESFKDVMYGNYEVIDNFNNTGRQLLKVKWDESYLKKNQEFQFEVNTKIFETNQTVLKFDVYGFSESQNIKAPNSTNTAITSTILEKQDIDDLNNDGVIDQVRLKSGNLYKVIGKYDLQTEKFVKGPSDTEWKKFTNTVPGGSIDYKLHMTNTTNKDISNMVLIDVLPSVNDLGITDNINRGSQFTPILTGPINLPKDWIDKVTVYYSTSKNPQRDELVDKVNYPENVEKLGNPPGAETPNWIEEANVKNWNTIHSFKIEMKKEVTWIKGVDIDITFNMTAPTIDLLDKKLLDPKIEPSSRAAWNSFAVTTDYSQPVEPLKVGVYIESNIGSLEIKKIDEKTKTTLSGATFELVNEEGTLVYTLTTDKNGIAKISDLPFGKYALKEVKAPNGYNLLLKPININITPENYEVIKVIENSKQEWSLPETGGIGTLIFYAIGGAIMIGGGWMLLSPKRRKTN